VTAGQLPILTILTEREWQRQVTDLAELYGWHWAHWRAARTEHGWRTPVSGSIGRGFVDLILVHPRRRRLLFVELKSDLGRLSREQGDVHAVLREAGLEVEVWRPRDWDRVVAAISESPAVSARREAVVTTSPLAGRQGLRDSTNPLRSEV
jgi:VRR-NUC domain